VFDVSCCIILILNFNTSGCLKSKLRNNPRQNYSGDQIKNNEKGEGEDMARIEGKRGAY
jgi:hypothetical protein